jgi:hypothetical protein
MHQFFISNGIISFVGQQYSTLSSATIVIEEGYRAYGVTGGLRRAVEVDSLVLQPPSCVV